MQVPGYHLSLSLFPKFLAIREQHSESARPLSTYSLHTLALAPSARLRRPMKIPRGATRSSERQLHTTQLSLRHRQLHGDAPDSSGEAFVSRSLAVLLQKAESDAGADQMFPTTVAPCCWLKDRLILASSRQPASRRSQMGFCPQSL